ncbi:MAG: tetratricopeptide repeat protein [Planctomycetia bacterium]|nr:tetratricopeptide repeat protein [Planctomycetia bacterium]
MNKTFFHVAFLACLASTGCASPFSLFAKKPQSFDDYKTEQIAKNQARVPSSSSLPRSVGETTELLNKAHTSFQQGLLNEAQVNYQAVLRKQPNHPEANHRLAVIADRQNDFISAERYYQAAVAAAPRDANILNDLGYSYLLQSRYSEAERYLTAALQQSPNQANAMNNLGMLYAKRGQADQALAMFRRTNSEAEAQAKLARYLPPNFNPANPNAATQPNTMLANNQQWQNNGSTTINSQFNTQQTPPQMRQPTNPNPAYAQTQSPANSQSAAINDPNISEPARQLKEAMEHKRREAIAVREARDGSERQRQASLLRQLREDGLERSNVTQTGGPQPGVQNGLNRGMQIPNNVPNGPIVIGPPVTNQNPFGSVNALPTSQPGPASQFAPRTGMSEGFPAAPQRADDPYSIANPNVNSNLNANNPPISQLWNVPNPPQPFGPNGASNPNLIPNPNAYPNNAGNVPAQNQNSATQNGAHSFNNSPLESMPDWPTTNSMPTNTLPSINPNSAAMRNNIQSFTPPNGAWPPGAASNQADDAGRAASRMGMSAGPWNLFPIAPGPASNVPNNLGPTPNATLPNGGGFNPNNGGSFNQQPQGPAIGEPPAGSFGPGGYDTSAKSPTMTESPAQFALRDRIPPSEQYQTPTPFNAFGSSNSFAAQPSSFAPGRGIPNPNSIQQPQSTRDLIAEMERASMRSTSDRSGGDDRWEQGSAPTGLNTNMTVPTVQGFLATQAGDNSLAEYERMSQLHNAEMNQIRQQLDSQRQQPGSENYFRSTTQSQLGSPNGNDPRLGSTNSSRRPNANSMPFNNAQR